MSIQDIKPTIPEQSEFEKHGLTLDELHEIGLTFFKSLDI